MDSSRQRAPAPTAVELRFDLHALPTAQHKAGLAGLLVLVETLRRRNLGPLPAVSAEGPGQVRVQLTREILDALFDDLYDGVMVESEVREKRGKGDPLREVRRTEVDRATGKEREVTRYVYEDPRPKAAFLDALGVQAPWVRLWRDAVWSTVRGIPKTRTPYFRRLEGKHTSEAEQLWRSLQRSAVAGANDESATEEIASSIFLGAQAHNAELVPFKGRVAGNFLLHFWPVVTRIFVPEAVDRDGRTGFVGYVFAVPEVSDLDGFAADFPASVAALSPDLRAWHPADAVVSLPEEGALEFLWALGALARARALRGETAFSLAAVELFHLQKQGNSIRTLTSNRVQATEALLRRYEALRRQFRDPLFRARRIANLLRDDPWYLGFEHTFAANPAEFFVGGSARFGSDVRRQFAMLAEQTREGGLE